jgi:hypothetical protein
VVVVLVSVGDVGTVTAAAVLGANRNRVIALPLRRYGCVESTDDADDVGDARTATRASSCFSLYGAMHVR